MTWQAVKGYYISLVIGIDSYHFSKMSNIPDLTLSNNNGVTTDLQSKSTKQPPRQPLQKLPALPINKRPAPVATICSPLDSITTLKSLDPLSPPVTPIRPGNKRSSLSAESIGLGSLKEEVSEAQSKSLPEVEEGVACSEPLWEATTPRLYTSRYKIQDATPSQHAEYGRGVWSVVYRAHEISTS